MRSLLVFLCLFTAFISATQATYTISGTVVIGNDNHPVKNVFVTIAAVTNPALKFSCLTRGDGRFTFKNLPAAKFSLSAERRNAQPESFHEFEGYSTAIVTGPGLHSEDIVFPLTQAGSISGVVKDEEGDPVRNAQVMLFHRGVFSGKLQTNLEKQQETDSSGWFRLGQLTAGNYVLAVQAQPWYAQNVPAEAQNPTFNPDFDVAYPITYSGDSTDPDSASPVAVVEGADTTVEITLRAEPAVHVELIHSGTGPRNLGLSLFAIGPGGFAIPMGRGVLDTGKHQEITGVTAGHYLAQEPGGAQKAVDLNSGSPLEIPSGAAASVSGRLTGDGQTLPPNMFLALANGTEHFQAEVLPDGSFTVSAIAPGRYQVELLNAPLYYVKAVDVVGRRAADGTFEVTEGSAVQLSVLVGAGLEHIDGIALKDGQPFAGAMVLLLPKDLSRTSLIRRDQSDSDGTFTLPSVAPGQYTLLAIDDGRHLAFTEPGVIAPYVSHGRSLEVPRRPNTPLKVDVLARQR